MRLCVIESDGEAVTAARRGDHLVDLRVAAPGLPGDIVGLLQSGPEGLARLADAVLEADDDARVDLVGVRYRVPVPRPGKILCLGLNYADHAAEGGHRRPEYPSFFMRAATSLVAHGEAILRPRASETLDFEAELVAVVGRRARHVPAQDALSVIAGYSVFNDGSIREYQRKTTQWTIGKNFDATGGFGPDVVTVDEVPPGARGLRIQSRLNGEIMQDANTDDMLVDVASTVVLLSECMTLEPGDLLVMGTPAGVGHARRPPVWMKSGDTCEVEIEGVGTLRNPVRDEA
jgi:2-keto-4-pentenoate hydratase/2-oxohepta-3-ene-1,7-dioic acid hydratase in catechol pathway